MSENECFSGIAQPDCPRYRTVEWVVVAAMCLDLFVGQLKSALTCLTCGYVSNTFDPFLDLSLPIPKVTHDALLTLVTDDLLLHDTISLQHL